MEYLDVLECMHVSQEEATRVDSTVIASLRVLDIDMNRYIFREFLRRIRNTDPRWLNIMV